MLSDLKELEKFLKICRKQGVTDISYGGTTVKLGELPSKVDESSSTDEIPTDELTAEQLMYFAVSGEAK